jgi:Uma2 family endonuclease
MSTATNQFTAKQLLQLPRGAARHELLRGELRTMSPSGSEHAVVTARLTRRIEQFASDHRLGIVFGAEAGFLIERDPDTVLAPGLAFVRQDRVPATGPPREYWPGAPDLAAEVVSPGDTAREVDRKADTWLRAGAHTVWLVDPRRRTGAVCRPDCPRQALAEDDRLEGGDLLPGFSCLVSELFWSP